MKAIILAGGEGTRLKPITDKIPKPMVPFFGGVLMDHTIAHLRANGVTDICAALGHLPDSIRRRYGKELTYSIEPRPLGTAGSVAAAPEEFLRDSFVVISGDAVCDFDISPAIQCHRGYDAAVTILTCRHRDPRPFGLVLTDGTPRVIQFSEKPEWSQVFTDMVNTGIYIISPRAMEYVPKGEKFDFSRDLFPLLLEKGETICAFECSGYWRDVGTPEDYLACCRDVLEGRVRLPLLKGVGFEPEIPGARIIPPCFISRDCIIGEGSVIGPHAVLQGGVTLGENSRVFGSVLTGITAGAGFAAEGCIVSRGTSFGDGCCVQPGAVVGEDCEFSPYDVVDSGLHSGGEHSRNSFTVRQALEAGMALGSGHSRVVICHTGGGRCPVLGTMAAGGAMSTGCSVTIAQCSHTCAARYMVRRLGGEAALFIEELGEDIRAAAMDGSGMPIHLKSGAPSYSGSFGTLDKVSGGDDIYSALGDCRHFPGLKVHFGGTGSAAEAARRMAHACGGILSDEEEGVPCFFIGDRGEIAQIRDETGGEYAASSIWAILLTALLRSGYRTLAIPENVSSQVQDYIRGLGAALLILNRDRGAEEAFLSIRELNDGILAAIFLCEYMAREKITMTDLARDVPGSGTAQANVSVPEGRSRAMGRLSAMPHFPSRRGIFFRDERGEVRIVPRSDAEQLRIFVSAHSTEAAQELCDFYRNIIEK